MAWRKGRSWLITSLSLALHALVLGWLARPRAPDALEGPPAMIVELVGPIARPARPRPADRSPAVARASEVVRSFASLAPPVAAAATVGDSPTPSPASGPSPGLPPPEAMRAALRASLGCSRPDTLTRPEREACAERLGRLPTGQTAYAAPMDPAKRAYFDELAAVGPTGGVSTDEKPGAVTPDHPYARVLKCSVPFGPGRKPKGYQGAIRLGRTPCAIPLQGSFFTPEAMVRKR